MAKADKTESPQVITEATFSNTAAGTAFRGDFEPERDRNGKIVYTRNLKVRTLQMDRTFPEQLSSVQVDHIAKVSNEDLEQPLKVQEGVDYRLSGEPTEFEGTGELPPSKVAYYKPIVLRDCISNPFEG